MKPALHRLKTSHADAEETEICASSCSPSSHESKHVGMKGLSNASAQPLSLLVLVFSQEMAQQSQQNPCVQGGILHMGPWNRTQFPVAAWNSVQKR